MFLSEAVARAIHADRIREIERTTRDRRLLATTDEFEFEPAPATRIRIAPPASRSACGDSAGQPA
jgi:hypothetical protein